MFLNKIADMARRTCEGEFIEFDMADIDRIREVANILPDAQVTGARLVWRLKHQKSSRDESGA